MQIQITTDANIDGGDPLFGQVEASVTDALDRFSAHITRVEVHLSDENGAKKSGPEDKLCMLEALVAGRPPISVRHQAATLEQAVDGAVEKLKHSLESTFGRLDKH
jgi:ribosome-associated translation inhibitor RaiA